MGYKGLENNPHISKSGKLRFWPVTFLPKNDHVQAISIVSQTLELRFPTVGPKLTDGKSQSYSLAALRRG